MGAEAGGEGFGGELLQISIAAGCAEAGGFGGVREQARKGGSEGGRLGVGDEKAGLAVHHDLGRRGALQGHARLARAHRLDEDETEALAPTWHNENRATRVELPQGRLGHDPRERDRGIEVRIARDSLKPVPVAAVAGDHEATLRHRLAEHPHRREEIVVALPVALDSTHDKSKTHTTAIQESIVDDSLGLRVLDRRVDHRQVRGERKERPGPLDSRPRDCEDPPSGGERAPPLPGERPPDLDPEREEGVRRAERARQQRLDAGRAEVVEDDEARTVARELARHQGAREG
ncbi:MAG: hypothetical protein M5U13_10685 [Thermoanaerobaculia bacterium]|nr:hypothetical protein [Thermoanaerobaculia bacterium]